MAVWSSKPMNQIVAPLRSCKPRNTRFRTANPLPCRRSALQVRALHLDSDHTLALSSPQREVG